jgi:hypothetical protein
MTEYILELRAILEEDGSRSPVAIKILAPFRPEDEQGYFCIVHAPLLLDQDKKIFGADPRGKQASLSVSFIKLLLENRKVLVDDGMPLPKLLARWRNLKPRRNE